MIKYGATPENWFLLDTVLGLTEDLLPVVSHPKAKISERSSLKDLGKVPSVFNGKYEVVGIAKWTQKKTHAAEIAEWMGQHDYGICVKTGHIMAFDIDITDNALSERVTAFIQGMIGTTAALRYRDDSAKCLIAFECESDNLFKRKVPVGEEIIEFLATGQQFVAYGTHPKGERYQWENEGIFPKLSEERVNEIWEAVVEKFGTGEAHKVKAARKRGDTVEVNDPICEQLDILHWGDNGAAYIECPFKHEHTMDSGDTETAYFPAGTGGYEEGHFRCLHAHCDGREDRDFMKALNIGAVAVGSFQPIAPAANEPEPLPNLVRDKSGAVLATVNNLSLVLSRSDICGYQIAFDEFIGDILVSCDSEEPRILCDEDYVEIRKRLEGVYSFKPIGTVMVREVVSHTAKQNKYDSAKRWTEQLVWDGVPRVDKFFAGYLGCEDTDLSREAGRYLFSALAGRALVPGIKADMVPILIGDQGAMKSSVIESLAPREGWFGEIGLTDDEANRARQLKGKMVAEIGEMRGLFGNTIENIKSFIAKRFDEWVPKYKEHSYKHARRAIFMGTSNHHEILNDVTGSRRFIPLEVGSIDIKAVRRDAEQLWAEGRAFFDVDGIQYCEVERLIKEHNEQYTMNDPWGASIRDWLDTPDMDKQTPLMRSVGITTTEVLSCALGQTRGAANSSHGKRVSELLRSMDFIKKRMRGKNGGTEYVWIPAVTQRS
ncbi:MAG: VapE domain-containing protein [Methylococcaceae bacterium]